MRYADVHTAFLAYQDELRFNRVESLAEADGILFTCPDCGKHQVICWQPQVPQKMTPGPGRWSMTGTGVNDLTLTAGSSSIQLGYDIEEKDVNCKAHFWITNGEIVT